jgi:hypothetical protein
LGDSLVGKKRGRSLIVPRGNYIREGSHTCIQKF